MENLYEHLIKQHISNTNSIDISNEEINNFINTPIKYNGTIIAFGAYSSHVSYNNISYKRELFVALCKFIKENDIDDRFYVEYDGLNNNEFENKCPSFNLSFITKTIRGTKDYKCCGYIDYCPKGDKICFITEDSEAILTDKKEIYNEIHKYDNK